MKPKPGLWTIYAIRPIAMYSQFVVDFHVRAQHRRSMTSCRSVYDDSMSSLSTGHNRQQHQLRSDHGPERDPETLHSHHYCIRPDLSYGQFRQSLETFHFR